MSHMCFMYTKPVKINIHVCVCVSIHTYVYVHTWKKTLKIGASWWWK